MTDTIKAQWAALTPAMRKLVYIAAAVGFVIGAIVL